jgi:hypothetical protein
MPELLEAFRQIGRHDNPYVIDHPHCHLLDIVQDFTFSA